ncbi:hypothetical protein P8452_32008 [Trifolium repens]|nr:hypothetical protein P8452_32008 [Trifolium repens]
MISGCVSVRDYGGALQLFSEMQNAGVKPTEVTLILILGACAETGALETGHRIHESLKVCEHKIEGDCFASLALERLTTPSNCLTCVHPLKGRSTRIICFTWTW